MTTTNAPHAGASPPGVQLDTIAGWLGMSVAALHHRLAKARELDLPLPEHVDLGRHRGKVWPNTISLRTEFEVWNQRYNELTVVLKSHPPKVVNLDEGRLRQLWREGTLTEWLEDFASVLTDLVNCDDPAARLVRVPIRPPTGRLKAISPSLRLVNWAYVENLRAWARDYAHRIAAADEAMDNWPDKDRSEHFGQWRKQLRKYLGANWEAVLNRCAAWTPRER